MTPITAAAAAALVMLVSLALPVTAAAEALSSPSPVAHSDTRTVPDKNTPAATGTVEVTVYDTADRLSADDSALMESQTTTIDFPQEVTRVAYLLFGSNDDNLNDTVRAHVETTDQSLISDNREKFAPGTLIIAIGLDPRRVGVYGGDDVLTAIDYYAKGREMGIQNPMKNVLRADGDPNFALAFLAGAKAAADPQAVAHDSGGKITGFLRRHFEWAIAIVVTAGALVWMTVSSFFTDRKHARKLRGDLARIRRDFTAVALDLDSIDIRAQQLSSPLATAEIRSQWETVKKQFATAHETLPTLDGLKPNSSLRAYFRNKETIESVVDATDKMTRAKKNIDTLFNLERGDAVTRISQLNELHGDITTAAMSAGENTLAEHFNAIDRRVLDLRDDPTGENFMDDYCGILADYSSAVDVSAKRQLHDLERSSTTRTTPSLYDSSWRPGYGYRDFVYYQQLRDWDAQLRAERLAREAERRSSSGSTTRGYSKGGFSGGGSSSSW
ncbi:DUF5129 domain-containing protein [Corynebacterium mendelii]|uniref:DUF5129 domain-containing protein n=1 Tax=Corynebacterium mendelii TaxID=2765362 RepID=A0A939E4J7_9CORY|nr:DUF5129 domain-containing protein [Corynebacterium mendelii]MBN9645272.1 DUF5129 domain-containing protein [Corynebacterium mendelii]